MLGFSNLDAELEDVVNFFSFRSDKIKGSEFSKELRFPNDDTISNRKAVA